VLGGFLALLSAATFAFNNACTRRGVLNASVSQALIVTVPIGVPIFFVVALVSGYLGLVLGFSLQSLLWLAGAGVLHFVWGRYCNYRATKALGSNLSGPIQQSDLVLSLGLAILFLGESLTPLRILGIALVLLGPALTLRADVEAGRNLARVSDQAETAAEGDDAPATPKFKPNFAEGYLFALLSGTGYGVSPILIRMGLQDAGPGASLAGGLVSYVAATLAVALLLLWPGQLRHALALNRNSAKWFTYSGILVCLSQIFRYLALAVAPVTVVAPILRLSLVFRVMFSWLINREHEVFSGGVIAGIAISLLGALALSLSADVVRSLLPLPDAVAELLRWQWP
jgi:uncharacterized membrane protein